METVEIALAANHAYFPGLLATAVSMARATTRAVRFWILDGGLAAHDRALLRDKVGNERGAAALRFVPVGEEAFEGFPEWNGGNRLTYARLMLPELLKDVETVIYCDVDFLWRADVGELWDFVRGEQAAGRKNEIWACRDPWLLTLEREGMPEDYICSGMMVMDLAAWRDGRVAARCMDDIRRNAVPFADQSAINRVVARKGFLPRKWGRFSREIARRELAGAWAIHYAGGAPWRRNYVLALITPADEAWYRFYGSLVGKSAARVKREFLGVKNYAMRRLAWILVHTAVLRTFFFAYLKASGRGGYVRYFKEERV